MMKNRKPYDKEIEYIESVDNSWIDTGYIPNTQGLEVQMGFMPIKVDYYSVWFSSYNGAGRLYYGIVQKDYSQDEILINYGTEDHDNGLVSGLEMNTQYNIILKDSQITINNKVYPLKFNHIQYPYTKNQIRIFNRPDNPIRQIIGRLYYFSIKSEGNKVLDLIPVRKGNVGYMYDKVSGKLYGNVGEPGSRFILGPDKEEDTNTFIIKGKFTDDSTNEDWWIKQTNQVKLDITSFVDPLTKEFFYFTDNKPSSLEYLFYENSALERIDEISGTDKCLSVKHLFTGCKNLKSVNLDKLDTSFCNDFREMFLHCESIESLSLLKMDTRQGASFDYCFQFMNSLKQLTLGKYFTCENATSIYAMFNNSKLLKEVTLHFDLVRCNNASALFSPSAELKTIKGSMANIGTSISLQGLTSLSFESAMLFINALEKVETAQIITLPVHIYDSLSEQQKAIISDKGWTIQKA